MPVLLLFLFLFFSCSPSPKTQESPVQALDLEESPIPRNLHSTWTFAVADSLWPATGKGQLDSILFKTGFFRVLAHKEDGKTFYSLLKRHNPQLAKDYRFAFPEDSIRAWKSDKTRCPDVQVCKHLVDGAEWNFLFRPCTYMTYHDARINEFPLVFQYIRCKTAHLQGQEFAVYQNLGHPSPYIQPMDGTQPYTNVYINGTSYKSDYQPGDTLLCGGQYYRIDSIDARWEKLHITAIDSLGKRYLPSSISGELLSHIGKKRLLVVDFWGTWCSWCIESFPKLKALHTEVGDRCAFVSICSDSKEKRQEADSIIRKFGITWPQIFDEDPPAEKERSYTLQLDIHIFPTYLLVKDDGEIIIQGSGKDGMRALQDYFAQ